MLRKFLLTVNPELVTLLPKEIYSWGANDLGTLGQNDTVDRSQPTQVGSEEWKQIEADTNLVAGIKSDGTLWTWGTKIIYDSPDLIYTESEYQSSPVQIGTETWKQIAVGEKHIIGIRSNDTLWAIGANDYGQLGLIGDETAFNYSWSQVSTGNNHTLAIRSDGTLWAAGNNSVGQLGSNNTINRTAIVKLGNSSWTHVSAGYEFSTAVRGDGALFAWGNNSAGQLGDGTTVDKSSPTQIGSSSWTMVSAGTTHAVAIRSDGGLFGWGRNLFGQIGDNTTVDKSSPVQLGSDSWTQVSAGVEHNIAIRNDGGLFTWGNGAFGKIGNASIVDRSSPVQIGAESWTNVAAGGYHNLAIRTDGALFGWGLNVAGQLGLSDTTDRNSPVQIGSDSWTQVTAGLSHTVALRTDGAIYSTGYNAFGQLGLGNTTARSVLTVISSDQWDSVGVGSNAQHSAGIANTGGYLYTWGLNSSGQLADKSTTNRTSIVQNSVEGLIEVFQVGNESWAQVAANGNTSAGIKKASKELYIWGDVANYQGANFGNTTPIYGITNRVGFEDHDWAKISAGRDHTLAIDNDGLLWAWGINNYGQVGDGTFANASSPVQIGTSSWTIVSAGEQHSVAIRSDGKLFAWGNPASGRLGTNDGKATWKKVDVNENRQTTLLLTGDNRLFFIGNGSDYGQDGLGTKADYSSPVQIGTNEWKDMALGEGHCIAVKNNGTLWGWGYSGYGQADLTKVYRSSPVQLGSDTDWEKVGAGFHASFAIKNDGSLYAWGQNSNGQLGTGNVTNLSTPTKIGTSSWTMVTSGAGQTHAITTDGKLFGWGNNNYGQVGDGTTVHRSSPVQILSGTSFTMVASESYGNHTLAVTTANEGYAWGYNNLGQLGIGTTTNQSVPQAIGGTEFVGAGQEWSLKVDTVGRLFTAGRNTNGQLGLNDRVHRSAFTQVGGSTWSGPLAGRIAARNRVNEGTYIAGTDLYTWGYNNQGQLGQSNIIDYSSPVQVASNQMKVNSPVLIDSGTWTNASAGYSHTIALNSNGAIFTTGSSVNGLLGNFTTGGNNSLNYFVNIGTSESWVQVSAGENHTAAVTSNGALYTWGSGGRGQLGHIVASTNNTSSPVQLGTTEYANVAVGIYHTLAIKNDGSLWALGTGSNGRLGTNSVSNEASPVLVDAGPWLKVYAGDGHNLGIKTDGTLWAWGLNDDGQLGQNDRVSRSSPVQIGTDSWTQIVAGAYHSLAIRNDSAIFSWGRNTHGQLGQNDRIHRSSPIQVGSSSWTSVGAGEEFSIATDVSGKTYGWGFNGDGRLGDVTVIHRSSPVQVGSDTDWSKTTAGWYTSYGIKTDGTLWAWGNGNQYALGYAGQGATGSRTTLTKLEAEQAQSWAVISAGHNHTAGIRSDGLLFTWGHNAHGQLGDGTIINKSSPIQIGSSSYTSVSAGFSFTVASKVGGGILAWGHNQYGQLGTNDTVHRSSPVQISSASFPSVTAGFRNTIATRSNGWLYGWGYNQYGELGVGDTNTRSTITLISSSTWSNEISMGYSHAAAIRTDGSLWTWGGNPAGNLGLKLLPGAAGTGGTNFIKLVDFQDPSITTWAQVAVGRGNHVIALRGDGTLWGWGDNSQGQLGDNTNVSKSSPIQIASGTTWRKVAVNNLTTYAIRSDNRLFAWGYNNVGQLGDNTTVTKSSPVVIGTSTWTEIEGGNQYVMAIRSDNKLFTWGESNNGKLGHGFYPAINQTISTISQIDGAFPSSWKQIAAGQLYHSAGIKSDGTLWTWGNNTNGALGHNNQIHRSSPVQVGSLTNWSEVSCGYYTTAAIKTDNTLWTWGANSSGELGLIDTILRSSPVQVAGTWSKVSAGTNYTLGIKTDGKLFAWGVGSNGRLATPINDTGSVVTPNLTPTPAGSGTASETVSWLQVAQGTLHTLAIRSDNKLFAWGYNQYGELGQNNTIHRSSPVQIGANNWLKVSAGQYASFAIRSDNTLWSWGQNNYGQLGHINTIVKSSPVQVPGSWSEVDFKGIHTHGIKTDSTLWSWGYNASGQLGDGTAINKSSPVQIGSATNWTKISASYYNGAAINSSNELYVWGHNSNGQLAQSDKVHRSSPVQVAGSWSDITQLTQYQGSAGIQTDGTLWTWGYGSNGQLGNGTTQTLSSPIQVGSDTDWSTVSSSDLTYGAIKTDGTLYMWGSNVYGELGNSANTSNSSSPVQIGGPATNVSWSSIGEGAGYHFGAISNNTLYMWGRNDYGQLYYNAGAPLANQSSPTQVGTSSWTQVLATTNFSMGITANNELFAWGFNQHGQLGQNNRIHRSSPVQIGSYGETWSKIPESHAYDQYHMGAIKSDGTLWTWGQNSSYGKLGQNNTIHRSSPVQVGSANNWIQIETGREFMAGRQSDNTAWGWGYNGGNYTYDPRSSASSSSPIQIGTDTWADISIGYNYNTNLLDSSNNAYAIGSTGAHNEAGFLIFGERINTSSPVQIDSNNWTKISTSHENSMAIRSDGTLWMWGYNTQGQLGQNNTIHRSSPVQVGSANNWAQISAGDEHSAAIDSVGYLYTWGQNNNGQLGIVGNGSVSARTSPTLIDRAIQDYSYTQLGSSKINSSYFIRDDGSLWVTGLNSFGTLGRNNVLSLSSPVQIGTSSWTQVTAAYNRVFGIDSAGRLFGWGNNSAYTLGDGTTIHRSSPVLINSDSWSTVSTGESHTLAIKGDGTLWAWGYNRFGLYGDGTIVTRSSPIQIGSDSWSLIKAGSDASYGIRGGKLYAWGRNDYGQLGINSVVISRSSPIQLGTSDWTSIDVGHHYVLALRSDNILFSWGLNDHGQLGTNDRVDRSSPVQITSNSWSNVSAGYDFAIARKTDGTLWSWGEGLNSRTGHVNATDRSSPTQIGTDTDWSTTFNAYFAHAHAVKTTGELYAWGLSTSGQYGFIGNGMTVSTSSPVQVGSDYVINEPESWTQVTCGYRITHLRKPDGTLWAMGTGAYRGDNATNNSSPTQVGTASDYTSIADNYSIHSAIDANGLLYLWGDDSGSQLAIHTYGNVNVSLVNSPVQVGWSSWSQVSAGTNFTLGLTTDGKLFSWGDDGSGRLGLGSLSVHRSSPTQIGTDTDWTEIGAAHESAMAIKTDGRLYAWGEASYGRIGTGNTTDVYSPVQINADITWAKLGEGSSTAFAIDSNNHLYGTGLANLGQLGYTLGTTASQSSPVQISTATWELIDGGISNAFGIRQDGTLWRWGYNHVGQAGDGTVVALSSMTQLGSANTWTDVSTAYHTGAISNGDLYLWGYNNTGQLGTVGDGSTTSKSFPVQVGDSVRDIYESWSFVDAGRDATYAIRNDGTLWAWGENDYGQLGLDDQVHRSSPVQVGSSSWTSISAQDFVLGLTTSNTIFVWGRNDDYQLGDETQNHRSSPIQVGSANNWIQISAGYDFSVALNSNNDAYVWGNTTSNE